MSSDEIEVVYNECFGGFSLSKEAAEHMGAEYRVGTIGDFIHLGEDVARDDPRLVAAVKELGQAAGGRFANLRIARVPKGVRWHIHEYDGWEHVAENHRRWTADGEADDE